MIIAVCKCDALCRAQLEEMLREYSGHNIHQGITVWFYEHAEDLREAAQRLMKVLDQAVKAFCELGEEDEAFYLRLIFTK